jgi:hypothetical protein
MSGPVTYDEVHQWLTERGWSGGVKIGLDPADWTWYRRFRDVVPNERPEDSKDGVVICVHGWDKLRHGESGISFEVELRAEPADRVWVKLIVYTLRNRDLFNKLDDQCAKLIRAWQACQ